MGQSGAFVRRGVAINKAVHWAVECELLGISLGNLIIGGGSSGNVQLVAMILTQSKSRVIMWRCIDRGSVQDIVECGIVIGVFSGTNVGDVGGSLRGRV